MNLKHRTGYFFHQQSIAAPDITPFLYECDTQQCNHCSVTVLLNPDRIRDRGLCHSCDRYICDPCYGARMITGQPCVTKEQRALLALKYQDMNLPFMDRGPAGELLFPIELLDKDKVY